MARSGTVTPEKPNLLAALAAAGEEDLATIREAIAEHEKELAGLRAAEKLLDAKLHGRAKTTRRPPENPGDGDGTSTAERIYEVLATLGKATCKRIAEQLGGTPQGVGRALSASNWFRKLDTGEWTIAKAGDKP